MWEEIHSIILVSAPRCMDMVVEETRFTSHGNSQICLLGSGLATYPSGAGVDPTTALAGHCQHQCFGSEWDLSKSPSGVGGGDGDEGA